MMIEEEVIDFKWGEVDFSFYKLTRLPQEAIFFIIPTGMIELGGKNGVINTGTDPICDKHDIIKVDLICAGLENFIYKSLNEIIKQLLDEEKIFTNLSYIVREPITLGNMQHKIEKIESQLEDIKEDIKCYAIAIVNKEVPPND